MVAEIYLILKGLQKEVTFLIRLTIDESNYLSNLLISISTAEGAVCFKQITFQTKLKNQIMLLFCP